MSALSDIQNSSLRTSLGNSCKTKIALAIHGAGSPAVDSTGTMTVVIDGVFKTHGALATQSLAVTHDCFGQAVGGNNLAAYVQPAGTTVYYVLSTNGSSIAVSQGSYLGQAQAYADLQRILTGKGDLPAEPAGYTAIGIVKVVTAGAATFTPGTTALDATNVTATYFDVERLPSVAP